MRTCVLCGNTYKYCSGCQIDALKPSWYHLFDNEICKDLDAVLAAHTAGRLSDEEALKKVEAIDYKKIDFKNELSKSHLDKILATKKPIHRPTKKVAEVSEEPVVCE